MNKTILAILLLLSASIAHATINLSANETYTFAYNITNTTDNTTIITPQNQEFYCSLPTDACMTNATLSLSLNPGQILLTNNGTCSVSASCAAASNICTVNTVLDRGQNYQNIGGSCNLTIACPTDTCEQNQKTATFTNNITITSNGQIITFNFNGQLQQFPITNGSFSNYFQQTYSCPVITVQNGTLHQDQLTGQDLLDYCKTAQPYVFGWVDQQMTQNTKNQDSYNACVIKETQAENGCQARVDLAQTETLHCQDQLNASNNDARNCYEQKAAVESTTGLYTFALILGGMYATMVTVACVVGWWLYLKQRRKTKEVDE